MTSSSKRFSGVDRRVSIVPVALFHLFFHALFLTFFFKMMSLLKIMVDPFFFGDHCVPNQIWVLAVEGLQLLYEAAHFEVVAISLSKWILPWCPLFWVLLLEERPSLFFLGGPRLPCRIRLFQLPDLARLLQVPNSALKDSLRTAPVFVELCNALLEVLFLS